MKIKAKLYLGLGILFALIIIVASMSVFYINELKKDTNNILVANYNTLEYSRAMFIALDKIQENPTAFTEFEKNLKGQQTNVTEPGEGEITASIVNQLLLLKQYPDSLAIKMDIRKEITQLMGINMNAIERKSAIANETAESAIL